MGEYTSKESNLGKGVVAYDSGDIASATGQLEAALSDYATQAGKLQHYFTDELKYAVTGDLFTAFQSCYSNNKNYIEYPIKVIQNLIDEINAENNSGIAAADDLAGDIGRA